MKEEMEVTNSSDADHKKGQRSTSTLRKNRRRRMTRIVILFGALVAVALAATAWLGFTGNTIKSELESASSLVPRIKDGVIRKDATAVQTSVDKLKVHTAAARAAGADPLWTAAQSLPWVGANFQAASEVATSADDVARLGAAPLASVFKTLDWNALTPDPDGVDLGPLTSAKPKLASAAHAVRQSSDRLHRIDSSTLFPEVSRPLIQAREQLDSMRTGLDTAAVVASIAPDMMGATSPRKYLLLIQNNAESRATGGIPGALAVLVMDEGRLSLGQQTSASKFGRILPPLPVDPEQQNVYSGRIGSFVQDVNLTPDFPTTSTTAVAMWQRKTGEALDGVISIDPVSLGYLLDATGPVEVTDPRLRDLGGEEALPAQLTGQNVVKTLLSDVYAAVPEPEMQDLYFAGVAEEIFSALSNGKSDAKKLLDGLSRGVNERRILLWSAVPDEQALVADYLLSGSVSGSSISPAQFGVYFNDGTGAKMDYYVKRTVQLVRECTTDGYGEVKVRITSKNTAPGDAATRLPPYVTGGGAYGVKEGSVQTNIVAYGPVQSNVETAMVNGRKSGFAAHRHSGRPVGTVTATLAPGESSTVEFTFGKIVQHTEPTVDVTPGVQPVEDVLLETKSAECSSPK